MRDLRGGNGPNGRPAWMPDVLSRFRESEIETWPEDTWEAFTLEALWQNLPRWRARRAAIRGTSRPCRSATATCC